MFADVHVYCARFANTQNAPVSTSRVARESQTMGHLKAQVKRLLRWREAPGIRGVMQPRSQPPLDGPAAQLLARAQQYYWFHSIDLGNGVVTPGSKSVDLLRAEAEAIFGPLSLGGKSVLDITAGPRKSKAGRRSTWPELRSTSRSKSSTSTSPS